MNETYLWDKTGQSDPEIEQLEALLSPLRKTAGLREPARRRRTWLPLTIAASIGFLGFLAWHMEKTTGAHWDVTPLSGQIDQSRLHSGESLETNGSSRAQLQLASTGTLELEPNTRIRFLSNANDKKTISLARGILHATIWASPGEFSVATPAATAVDLGCIYTVQTNDEGDGFVRVEAGWVALEEHGQESFIPGGSVCRINRARGPGIPYIETSADALKQLIGDFDATGSTVHLQSGLASAVRSDDVTLWHLLRRVPTEQRGVVFQRLTTLVPLPASITSSDVDAIWKAFGYGDVDWWRKWKSR